MKQSVCLDYDNPKDTKHDKNQDCDVDDFSEQYVVSLPPEAKSRYTTNEANNYRRNTGVGGGRSTDDETFMLTQELTFDKLWGKFVKRVKKNKKAIYKKNTTRSLSCDETTSRTVGLEEFQEKESVSKNKNDLLVDITEDAKYSENAKYSKYVPKREIDSFKMSSSSSSSRNASKSSNEPPNSSTKQRQLPKHLVSTSTMLASGSAAYRHKYVPGSLSKRPVYGMMGHGLSLNGQFGARPRRRCQAAAMPADSGLGGECGDSNEFQGAFGKTPGFMPPYCQARPKVVFALKF